eukprot:TRINITY_DN2469_c0_g1_i1.p1 TRINITY_DN2469_c0_g1~~TRINITY_DN2469_c0_g1_i1.p1  ORF type:complete len:529 (+),score=224.63 TRINITY_DN2469_c0_g1_i1:61-1647(+)
MTRAFACAVLLAGAAASVPAKFNTSSWVGSAYTPAAAPNALWWGDYDGYEATVDREFGVLASWGAKTIRVFLHSMVYARNGTKMHDDMDRFLGLASKHGLRTGFVFFDDCWDHSGADLDAPCVPRKGVHNGCWKSSPQDVERTSISKFEPYVASTVARFASDPRVQWWEVYNEPQKSNNYSMALRDAGFKWAKAQNPTQAVLSCWDDNADTEIVDHHDYTTQFTGSWMLPVTHPNKTGLITEGGSRWFAPPFSADAGSPLTVLNFLSAVKRDPATADKVPGIILCWTWFVGNDNTRWHWSSPEGADEPVVPWDGLFFPDGTPVSYTEMGAFRLYATGVNDFLAYDDFLPKAVVDGDHFMNLAANQVWHAGKPGSPGGVGGALAEASFWPEASSGLFHMTSDGYNVEVDVAKNLLVLQIAMDADSPPLGTFDLSTLDNKGCKVGAWNVVQLLVTPTSVSVWFNTMLPETGFVGDASDKARVPHAPAPRITIAAVQPPADGDVMLWSDVEGMRVDYISKLPVAALPNLGH